MDRPTVLAWVARYERAWRSAATGSVGELFTPDAEYRRGPFVPPVTGLPAISRMWREHLDDPRRFTLAAEVAALDGATAVVRVEIRYGEPGWQEYHNLWVLRFAADGRCAEFAEWPHRRPGPTTPPAR